VVAQVVVVSEQVHLAAVAFSARQPRPRVDSARRQLRASELALEAVSSEELLAEQVASAKLNNLKAVFLAAIRQTRRARLVSSHNSRLACLDQDSNSNRVKDLPSSETLRDSISHLRLARNHSLKLPNRTLEASLAKIKLKLHSVAKAARLVGASHFLVKLNNSLSSKRESELDSDLEVEAEADSSANNNSSLNQLLATSNNSSQRASTPTLRSILRRLRLSISHFSQRQLLMKTKMATGI